MKVTVVSGMGDPFPLWTVATEVSVAPVSSEVCGGLRVMEPGTVIEHQVSDPTREK